MKWIKERKTKSEIRYVASGIDEAMAYIEKTHTPEEAVLKGGLELAAEELMDIIDDRRFGNHIEDAVGCEKLKEIKSILLNGGWDGYNRFIAERYDNKVVRQAVRIICQSIEYDWLRNRKEIVYKLKTPFVRRKETT